MRWWPFGAKAQPYLGEFDHWNAGSYPYERLICGRCLTEHAVYGCEIPEHHELTRGARELGLDQYPDLVAGPGWRYWLIRRKLGRFLYEHRVEILGLRRVYAYFRKGPMVLEEEQETATQAAR